MPIDTFQGKVAFITGGASGIGLGMARTFPAEWMKVAIVVAKKEHIADATRVLAGSDAVHFVRTNVADRDSVRDVAEEVIKAFRRHPCTLQQCRGEWRRHGGVRGFRRPGPGAVRQSPRCDHRLHGRDGAAAGPCRLLHH